MTKREMAEYLLEKLVYFK